MNITDNLPSDPSKYLDKIKEFITSKNTELGSDAKAMNLAADKLQENIDSVVLKVKSLEDAQSQMTETIANNNEKISKMKERINRLTGALSEKHDENDAHKGKQEELEAEISKLEQENKELKESVSTIDQEKGKHLDTVSDLQSQLTKKEQEWEKTKQSFLNELKLIDSALQEYVGNTKENITKTTQMLDRANERLMTVLPFGESRKMFFGANDPYEILCTSIQQKNLKSNPHINSTNVNEGNDELELEEPTSNMMEIIDESDESDESDELDDSGSELGSEEQSQSSLPNFTKLGDPESEESEPESEITDISDTDQLQNLV